MVQIGHILHSPPLSVLQRHQDTKQTIALLQDKWTRELEQIALHYNKKKALQFVNLQIPSVLYSQPDAIKELLYFIHQLPTTSIQKENTRIGIDFSTTQLVSVQKEELRAVRDSLIKASIPTNIFTIACNAYTYTNAHRLVKYLQRDYANHDIDIVATELLRSDPNKPGQLSASYDYHPKHRIEAITEEDSHSSGNSDQNDVNNEEIKDLLHATKDFQRALDRCIQVEKLLLEKVSRLILFFLMLSTRFNTIYVHSMRRNCKKRRLSRHKYVLDMC